MDHLRSRFFIICSVLLWNSTKLSGVGNWICSNFVACSSPPQILLCFCNTSRRNIFNFIMYICQVMEGILMRQVFRNKGIPSFFINESIKNVMHIRPRKNYRIFFFWIWKHTLTVAEDYPPVSGMKTAVFKMNTQCNTSSKICWIWVRSPIVFIQFMWVAFSIHDFCIWQFVEGEKCHCRFSCDFTYSVFMVALLEQTCD